MKIKKMISQHRRDFRAIIQCEGCGNEENLDNGYDDRYYHDEVLPNMKCKKCSKSRNELGVKGTFTNTKYPEGYQV